MKKQNTLITQESIEVVLRKEFVDNPDVMMINALMWQKETLEEMTWYDAMEYAKNLRLGGYDDWRLPTIEELEEVVSSCGGINIKCVDDDWGEMIDKNEANKSYQECYKSKGFTSSYYWSSTASAYYSPNVWVVSFYDGSSNYYYKKENELYVRCVRAGQ